MTALVKTVIHISDYIKKNNNYLEPLLGSRKRLLCQYLVQYSPGILKKKTKVKDIFYTDKKFFIKFNVD